MSTTLLRFTVYTALVLALCAIGNAAGWLVQQVAVVLWPIVGPFLKEHSDALLIGLLALCVAVLFVAAVSEDGRR